MYFEITIYWQSNHFDLYALMFDLFLDGSIWFTSLEAIMN